MGLEYMEPRGGREGEQQWTENTVRPNPEKPPDGLQTKGQTDRWARLYPAGPTCLPKGRL